MNQRVSLGSMNIRVKVFLIKTNVCGSHLWAVIIVGVKSLNWKVNVHRIYQITQLSNIRTHFGAFLAYVVTALRICEQTAYMVTLARSYPTIR